MIKDIIYKLGALLLLIGAALPLLVDNLLFTIIVFGLGVALFVPCQVADKIAFDTLVIRRLRRQQLFGAAFLLITWLLLLTQYWHIAPLCSNEWKITLTIGVLLQTYSIFRLSYECEKESKKADKHL